GLPVPEHTDLVAARRLPGDSPTEVLPRPIREPWTAGIGGVEPLGRIPSIQVVELVRVDARAPFRPGIHEEPDAILLDGAADGAVQIVDLARGRRGGHPRGPDLVVIVVGEEVSTSPAEIGRPREVGSAGF